MACYPGTNNYIYLKKLEYELLVLHVPCGISPSRLAFIGYGPFVFSSFLLVTRYLPYTMFEIDDLFDVPDDRADKLFCMDLDVSMHMSFHMADIETLPASSPRMMLYSWTHSLTWTSRTW